LPLQRSLGAALVHRDQLLGSIHVANKATDYTDEDLRLLQHVTAIIAPVLSSRRERDRHRQSVSKSEAALLEAKRLSGEQEAELEFLYRTAPVGRS